VEWVLFQLRPRNELVAARTAAWIYLISALVIASSNFILPLDADVGPQIVARVAPIPLVLFAALMAMPSFRHKQPILMITPFLGVGVVLTLDLATLDSSAGAQAGFCLPVLFAASQLRFLAATLTAVGAIAGEALLVARLMPTATGALDVVDVTLVLGLMTGMLVVAGQRQDKLVALLESQASLDPLTGLVTRRVLDEAVRKALSGSANCSGAALILVDVDQFKAINDGYGHPVGDDALVHISRLLTELARPETVISRLGGDEIAVLLPDCTEPVARRRAHEFLHAVRDSPLLLPNGSRLPLSISLGVAHVPTGQSQLREIYAAADASLYQAKRSGRGRVGQPASGHPLFEPPTAVSPADPGSEGLVDGALEMRDMPDGVLQGDVGLTGDDRIDHR
jgi:diguanylate cyclase (GGDEF)-like protein